MSSSYTVISTVSVIVATIVLLFAIYVYNGSLWQTREIPTIELTWWGPGKQPKTVDVAVKPFVINVDQDIIDDLHKRLDNVRSPRPALEDVQFEYGFNADTLKNVMEYWRKKYDWRKQEKQLNRFPQFKTNIQGLDIHFLHVKPSPALSKNKQVRPLLLLHGWPGSVKEFYKFIDILNTNENEVMFEIVAPSLPGYAFSSGTTKQGLGPPQMAQIMRELMIRLKYEKFYIQGGDWGSAIGGALAVLYPNNVLGFHTNMCVSQSPPAMIWMTLEALLPGIFGEKNYEGKPSSWGKIFTYVFKESGYMHLQSTKPDTIGVALTDSPVGLAAYILEKFSTWTNPKYKYEKDGSLLKKFTYDDLLDNIMLYWVTNSATTSMRLYKEAFSNLSRNMNIENLPISVPTACAKFKHEILYQSDFVLSYKYANMVQSTHFQDGGHFAAMELPEILAKDFVSAVIKMEEYNKNYRK